MLRFGGEPLPPGRLPNLQRTFQADLTGVREHRGPRAQRAAALMRAEAFTVGQHIVYGRETPEIQAHELTHTVSPVRRTGTDLGGGLGVTDPGHAGEVLAARNGRRVAAGGSSLVTGGHPHPAHPAVAQRAVGFEFELSGWRFEERKEGGTWKLKKDTKAALVTIGAAGKAYISADNGNVEYVTKPLSTWDDVVTAIGDIIACHENLISSDRSWYDENGTRLSGDGHTAALRITAASQSAGHPQATIGVRMENITTLYARLADLTADGPPAEHTAEQKVGAAGWNTAEVNTTTDKILSQIDGPQPQNREAVRGLLAVFIKTMGDINSRDSAMKREDAKYAMDLMPRTDFISMRESLGADAAWLAQAWAAGTLENALTATLPADWLAAPVYPFGYKADDSSVAQTFTRRQLWDNIVTGAAGSKDLLSPPPGYRRHTADGPNEGIGAMGVDPAGLSLFELRNLSKGVPYPQWMSLVRAVTALAADATGDAGLRPPTPAPAREPEERATRTSKRRRVELVD